jgi:hypothetical protein
MDLSGLDSCIVRSVTTFFCGLTNPSVFVEWDGREKVQESSNFGSKCAHQLQYGTSPDTSAKKTPFPLVLKTWHSNSLGQAIPKEFSEFRVELNRKVETAPIAGYQESPGAVPTRIQRRECRMHLQTPLFNSPNPEDEKDQDSQVPSSAGTRKPELLLAKTSESFMDRLAQLCESNYKSLSFKFLTTVFPLSNLRETPML